MSTIAALTDLIGTLPQVLPFDGNGTIPDTTPETPPGMAGFLRVVKWISWGAFAVCTIAFLISGGMLAMSAINGREMQGAKGLVVALIAAVIIGSAGLIFGALL